MILIKVSQPVPISKKDRSPGLFCYLAWKLMTAAAVTIGACIILGTEGASTAAG